MNIRNFLLLLIFAITPYSVFAGSEIADFLSGRLQNWNEVNAQYDRGAAPEIAMSATGVAVVTLPVTITGSVTASASGVLSRSIPQHDIHFALEGFILSGSLRFVGAPGVQPSLFVSSPDGGWQQFAFADRYIAKTGNMKTGIRIPVQIPLWQEGIYRIELLDEYGFPVYNQQFQVGQLLATNVETNRVIYDAQVALHDINVHRNKLGLEPVQKDIILQNIAKRKLDDMMEREYIGHFSDRGKDIRDFITSSERGLFIRIGENVAGGENATLASLYQGLLDSPAHKRNMLFAPWRHVGMAYGEKNGNSYFVQVFSD